MKHDTGSRTVEDAAAWHSAHFDEVTVDIDVEYDGPAHDCGDPDCEGDCEGYDEGPCCNSFDCPCGGGGGRP